VPKKRKKKSWTKPIIDDRPCDACGEIIDMNGDGWIVTAGGKTIHYGAFSEFRDKCFNKLINLKTIQSKTDTK
tara:strand:- start:72 stop:290 length:219 start_codon:yes stop_codon:yes gene_type:complete